MRTNDFDDLASEYTRSSCFKNETADQRSIRWAGYYDALRERVEPLLVALKEIEEHHGQDETWRTIAYKALNGLKEPK